MSRSKNSPAETGSAQPLANGFLARLAHLPSPNPWLACGAAVVATALAVALRWWLGLLVGHTLTPFITLYPVVMLAALLGGVGPGLLATALAGLAVAFFFLPPTPSLVVANPADQLGLALFCAINLAVTFICAGLRTARHRAFAEARRAQASEVRYRRLFEAAHDGVLLLDTGSHKIMDANPFITQLLGYSRDDLLGKELWQIGLLKDAPASRGAFDQLAREGHIRYEDLPLRTKTGEAREVEFVSNLYDENGRSVIQCNIRDITDRKRAEQALRESEQRLTADLDAMNRLHDLSTRFLQQHELHTLLDALLEAAIASVGAQMGHVHLLDPATGELPIAAQRGLDQPFLGYFSHIKPGQIACGTAIQTAQCIVVEDVTQSPLFLADPAAMELKLANRIRAMICTPLIAHADQPIGVLSIDFHEPHRPSDRDLRFLDLLARQAADFIERTQTDQALHRSEERHRLATQELQAIMDATPVGLFVAHDPQCHLITGNRPAHEILGVPPEERNVSATPSQGGSPYFRIHRDGQEASGADLPMQVAAATGVTVRNEELEVLRRDGTRRTMLVTAAPLLAASGQPRGAVGAATDITDRKQAEEALQAAKQDLARANAGLEQKVRQRTAKLQETVAELEGFSYSLVHDMRAPLRAMQSYATVLQEDSGPHINPAGLEYLRRIKVAANRMDQLIADSLNYSRILREDLPLEPVNLGKLLRGIVETYPNLQPPGAEITLEVDNLMVLGNTAGLTQVFSNLLGNAVKFVAPGVKPKVRVWAQLKNGQPPRGEETEMLKPAPKVLIWVIDNGIGIPREGQEKIFGMFQRMHRAEEYPGTGIGLAIVRKSLDRMGGLVCLDSEPGKGSRFVVELPRLAEGEMKEAA